MQPQLNEIVVVKATGHVGFVAESTPHKLKVELGRGPKDFSEAELSSPTTAAEYAVGATLLASYYEHSIDLQPGQDPALRLTATCKHCNCWFAVHEPNEANPHVTADGPFTVVCNPYFPRV